MRPVLFLQILSASLLLATAACSTASKGPTADGIEAALISRTSDFRACYEREQPRRSKPAEGRVATRFMVSASGEASKATVTSTTLNQPKVEACILKTIQSTRFPQRNAKSDPVEVSYPFDFNAN